jgi:hypothetical protein
MRWWRGSEAARKNYAAVNPERSRVMAKKAKKAAKKAKKK